MSSVAPFEFKDFYTNQKKDNLLNKYLMHSLVLFEDNRNTHMKALLLKTKEKTTICIATKHCKFTGQIVK